jgi:hypothetical protein
MQHTERPATASATQMLQGKRSVSLEMNVILVYQNAMELSVCSKRKGCSYAGLNTECLDTATYTTIDIINWLRTVKCLSCKLRTQQFSNQ